MCLAPAGCGRANALQRARGLCLEDPHPALWAVQGTSVSPSSQCFRSDFCLPVCPSILSLRLCPCLCLSLNFYSLDDIYNLIHHLPPAQMPSRARKKIGILVDARTRKHARGARPTQVATGDGWAEYVARPIIGISGQAEPALAVAAVNASITAASGEGAGLSPDMNRGAALFFGLFYLARCDPRRRCLEVI